MNHQPRSASSRVLSTSMPHLLARIIGYSRSASICFVTRDLYATCRPRFQLTGIPPPFPRLPEQMTQRGMEARRAGYDLCVAPAIPAPRHLPQQHPHILLCSQMLPVDVDTDAMVVVLLSLFMDGRGNSHGPASERQRLEGPRAQRRGPRGHRAERRCLYPLNQKMLAYFSLDHPKLHTLLSRLAAIMCSKPFAVHFKVTVTELLDFFLLSPDTLSWEWSALALYDHGAARLPPPFYATGGSSVIPCIDGERKRRRAMAREKIMELYRASGGKITRIPYVIRSRRSGVHRHERSQFGESAERCQARALLPEMGQVEPGARDG